MARLKPPATAKQVHDVFADVLDSLDGVRSQLLVIACCLKRVEYGEFSDLALTDLLGTALVVGDGSGFCIIVGDARKEEQDHKAWSERFSVLEFSEPDDPRIVYTAQLTGGSYLEILRDVGTYRLAYEQLRVASLGPEDSAEFISRLAGELTPP